MNEQSRNMIPLSRIQKLIGKLMLQSKKNRPFAYMESHADLTDLNKIRKPYSRSVGIRVATNDFFYCAIARAIKKFPLMAGKIDPTGRFIQISPSIGIGFAVAAPQGLVVPVIKNVDKKPLTQIAAETNALLRKARSNKLLPSDFDGENIVLSGLGMYGISSFFAIAPPMASGIISIGNIEPVIVPSPGGMVVRKKMSISLAVDMRITDEVYAAKFLRCIVDQIEDPYELTKSAGV